MKKYISKAKKILASMMSAMILSGVIITPTVFAAIDVSNTIPVKESNKPANQIFKPDNQGEYSSWETPNSGFIVNADYAFRPRSTSDTAYTVIGTQDRSGGIQAMNEADNDGDKIFNTDDDYIFSTKNNAKGSAGWKGTDFQIYNVQSGKYDNIDMKVTVVDWTVNSNAISPPYVYLQHDARPEIRILGLTEAEIQIDYYKAGTNTPYIVTGNLTFNDIDDTQYVAIKHNQVMNIFADPESKLSYGSVGGYDVFWCPELGNDMTGTPKLAMGATFSSNTLNLKFGTKHNGTWSYFGFYAYSMVKITPPDPKKAVSDGNETDVIHNTLSSPNESFTYQVRQAVPAGMSDEHFYSKFVFEDQIDTCLSIDSVKVMRGSADKSDLFHINVVDNKVTATAKNLKDEDFYGGKGRNGAVYDLVIKCHINKSISHEILKSHGHFSDTETQLIYHNKGTVTINDTLKVTNDVSTDVHIPTTNNGDPGLNIIKSVTPYEYQVGDDINYKIVVDHSNQNATAVDVVVSDTSLPEGMVIDESTIKVSGIINYQIKIVSGGWELTAPTLEYGKTITIEFTARASKEINGTIVPNAAKVIAWQVPEKFDHEEVYINSPKLSLEKKADKKEYRVGDTAKYELNLTQINDGCFMRDITISDEIKTEGVKLSPGSIQIMDNTGKIITHECEIKISGNKFEIVTNRNLGDKTGVIPPKMTPYDNLKLLTGLRVTYDVTILDGLLAGETIENIAVSPATKNTNEDIIKDDPAIPSGGDSTEEKVNIKSPVLNIKKESDKSVYQVGETGKYTVTINQIKEDCIAKNVIVSDHFISEGMSIHKDSIQVMKNGEDITQSCEINTDLISDTTNADNPESAEEEKAITSFQIKINTNMSDHDMIVITYAVTFTEATQGKTLTNIAEAKADNAPKVEVPNEVNIPDPADPILKIEKKSDKNEYAVGESGQYTLLVTQSVKDAVAKKVEVKDQFILKGMKIDQKSIIVKLNGKNITKNCEITATANGFMIKTGIDLSDTDKLEVTYKVKYTKETLGKKLINIAKVKGENTPEAQTQNEVTVPKPDPEKTTPDTSNDEMPRTGDDGQMGLWLVIACISLAGIVFIFWNDYRNQKRNKNIK